MIVLDKAALTGVVPGYLNLSSEDQKLYFLSDMGAIPVFNDRDLLELNDNLLIPIGADCLQGVVNGAYVNMPNAPILVQNKPFSGVLKGLWLTGLNKLYVDGGSGLIEISKDLLSIMIGTSQAAFLNPQDPSTIFSDPAGTTPANYGDAVALALDHSKGLVLGPELVANGGFEEGSTGWSVAGNDATHIVTFANGGARYQSSTTSPSLTITQSPILTVGKRYRVIVDTSAHTSGSIKTDSFSSTVAIPGQVGRFTFYGVASSPTLTFNRNTTDVDLTIDNISVRELPGNHFTQPNGTARPIYGRHPKGGRRNLLPATASINTYWFYNGLTGVEGYGIAPDGSKSSYLSSGSGTRYLGVKSVTAGALYTYSAYVKPVNLADPVQLFCDGGNTQGEFANAIFELDTKTVIAQSPNVELASVTPAANGFFRVQISFRAVASGEPINGHIWGYADKPTEWWGMQFEAGAAATPYQRVGSEYNITEAGVPDVRYLDFQNGNKWMVTAAIDFTGTDEVTVIAAQRKMSDAAIGMIAELGAGVGQQFQMYNNSAPQSVFVSRGTVAAAAVSAARYPSPHTAILVGEGIIPTDFSRLTVNNDAPFDNTADQGTGTFGNYPLYIGARNGTALFFTGYIYELLTIGKKVSEHEIASYKAKINNYLSAY